MTKNNFAGRLTASGPGSVLTAFLYSVLFGVSTCILLGNAMAGGPGQ